ncbi:Cytochrome P450 81Q32 [Linum perenne]
MVGKYIGYNHTTIIDTSHGEHWRNLRRIAAVEIFSARRLAQFANIRKDEVKLMLLRLCNNASKKVELRELFQDLTFNNMMRMIAGKRYYGNVVEDREDAAEFKEIMTDVMANAGVSNSADFLPILNWINGGKFEKKLISLSQRLDKFLQKLIDERRNRDKSHMIDHLLFLHQSQPEYYSDQIIKGFIQTMLLAGTDTAAATLEWAMCNLLNHPHMINKARYEIERQIGQDQIPRLLEESDLPKLHYLQDIISETHRLHPSAPLLLPHNSSRDLTLAGYHIPENTMLIVNAWAIHRDPRVWDDPTSFKPERFESCNDHRNKLILFGMGRRACPGAGLAKRVIGLSLGSLIQCFDWGKCGFIDMMEGAGVTMPMLIPLQANCRPRPVVSKLGLA